MARPPGVANKNKHAMLASLKKRLGDDFDLIGMMADQAIKLHEKANATDIPWDRVNAINALDKVAAYVYPKLKAIEVDLSNEDGTLRPVTKIKLIAVRSDPALPQALDAAIVEHIEHLGSMD